MDVLPFWNAKSTNKIVLLEFRLLVKSFMPFESPWFLTNPKTLWRKERTSLSFLPPLLPNFGAQFTSKFYIHWCIILHPPSCWIGALLNLAALPDGYHVPIDPRHFRGQNRVLAEPQSKWKGTWGISTALIGGPYLLKRVWSWPDCVVLWVFDY